MKRVPETGQMILGVRAGRERVPREKWSLALLGLICAFGFGLRLGEGREFAPTNPDEGMYLRQARLMYTVQRIAFGLPVPVVAPNQRGIWRYIRKGDWYNKPCWLHSFLIGMAMNVTGPDARAALAVNCLASMAGVVLVFAAGRRMLGSGAGVCAAAFLSISGYWYLYSRSAWAETDSAVFALLAFCLAVFAVGRPRGRVLYVASGVATACAALCHYRLLYVIVLMGVVMMILERPSEWLAKGAALLAGFFGTLMAVGGLTSLASEIVDPSAPFRGLLAALSERYVARAGSAGHMGLRLSNALAYGYYIVRNHGLAGCALIAAGVAGAALSQPRRPLRVSMVMAIGPILVLCGQVWIVMRGASVSIPFLALVVGCGLTSLWRRAEGLPRGWRAAGRALLVGVACWAAVENVLFDLRVNANRMGHAAVACFLKRQGAQGVYADPESAAIYNWYVPSVRLASMWQAGGVPEGSARAEGRGEGVAPAFYVFDAQRYHMTKEEQRAATQEVAISASADLALVVPNLSTLGPEFMLDGPQAHDLSGMLDSLGVVDSRDFHTIRVYRLEAAASGDRVDGARP